MWVAGSPNVGAALKTLSLPNAATTTMNREKRRAVADPSAFSTWFIKHARFSFL